MCCTVIVEWSSPVGSCFGHLPRLLGSLLGILRKCERAELPIASLIASSSNARFRHGTSDDMGAFRREIEQ